MGVDKKTIWSNNLADEFHKQVRHRFPKRRVMVKGIDDTWAIDLVDMAKYAAYNLRFKFLLVVIDIFSKYGWLIPLNNKSGKSVTMAFATILKQRKPEKVWGDKGKEFYNKDFKSLLKEYGIELYSTENEEKSSVVERWIRTMKERMFNTFLQIVLTNISIFYHRWYRNITSQSIVPLK